jgi:hypothetical protein
MKGRARRAGRVWSYTDPLKIFFAVELPKVYETPDVLR